MKYITLITLSFFLFFYSSAQDNTIHKIKFYETWISLNDKSNTTITGILYEIKDSSIVVLNSFSMQNYLAGKIDTTRISFDKIDLIKTRRKKSIGKAILIGSVSGYALGASYIYTLAEGMGVYTGIIVFYMGFPYAILGAGTGAIIGSIKDRIPVGGSIENFKLYRSTMQDYSYVQESPISSNKFEHKGFMGFNLGPSFPSGDFLEINISDGNAYSTEKGFGGNIFLGYRFTKNIGLYFSEFYNEFSIKKKYSTSYWGVVGIVVGPMLSIPVKSKLYFDLKPSIGYANAYLVIDNIEMKDGNGLGLNINTSLLYNFSNQFGLIAEAGYFFTHQKFDDKSVGNYKLLNFNLGFVYRFSKKSL